MHAKHYRTHTHAHIELFIFFCRYRRRLHARRNSAARTAASASAARQRVYIRLILCARGLPPHTIYHAVAFVCPRCLDELEPHRSRSFPPSSSYATRIAPMVTVAFHTWSFCLDAPVMALPPHSSGLSRPRRSPRHTSHGTSALWEMHRSAFATIWSRACRTLIWIFTRTRGRPKLGSTE